MIFPQKNGEFFLVYSVFDRLPKKKPKFLISEIENKQIIAFSKWKKFSLEMLSNNIKQKSMLSEASTTESSLNKLHYH